MFDEVDKSIPVFVHQKVMKAYKEADGWKEFSTFKSLEGSEDSCLKTIVDNDDIGTEGREEWAKDMSQRIVAVAGMKLNEANPGVRAFTEGFTRVVIYPTRSLNAVEGKEISEEEKVAEEQRARKINFAAMRGAKSRP